MNNLHERRNKRKEREVEQTPVAFLSALDQMVTDQMEHEAKHLKKPKMVAGEEPIATTPCSDRCLRQMLLLIGFEAELAPSRTDLPTIPNPKLLVLYFAIAKYVRDYNAGNSDKISFYSPIASPTDELLQAIESAADDVVFYHGLGLFDLKENHSVCLYVNNPELSSKSSVPSMN